MASADSWPSTRFCSAVRSLDPLVLGLKPNTVRNEGCRSAHVTMAITPPTPTAVRRHSTRKKTPVDIFSAFLGTLREFSLSFFDTQEEIFDESHLTLLLVSNDSAKYLGQIAEDELSRESTVFDFYVLTPVELF